MSKNNIISESFSGVRGIYGQGIDTEYARRYARVFVLVIKQNKNIKDKKFSVVIGADTRKSSSELLDVFVDEFISAGFTVYDLGFTTTPVAEFAVRYFDASGGVMITASHNEPEFNGWKLLDSSGSIVSAQMMDDIITKVHNWIPDHMPTEASAQAGVRDDIRFFDKLEEKGKVIESQSEIISAYIKNILTILGDEAVQLIRNKKYAIVADPNGSAVWEVLQMICKELDIQVKGINTQSGVFNRAIEPNYETLTGLVDIVADSNAQFGCGFDCDADRVEIVLSGNSEYAQKNGCMISGQYVLALGVDSVLSNLEKGQKVVINFATSNLVNKIAEKFSAKIIEVDVGEINVVEAMRSYSAAVGGEGSSSGVIIRGTTCRDGIIVILLILKIMAERGQSLDEILQQYPVYWEERLKVSCKADEVVDLRRNILQYFQDNNIKTVTADSDTSGVKAYLENNIWIFFRASKTEPGVFRIIVNGPDKQGVEENMEKAQAIFNQLKN